MEKATQSAGILPLILATILLGGLAALATPVPNGSPVAFVTVAQGTTSGVHAPIREAIHDPESWRRLWIQLMTAGHQPPTVDFGRDMIIALSSGPVPEPAILTIRRITRLQDRLVVWYAVAQPRPLPEGGSTRTSAPFHVVRLARSLLPVDFVFLKTPPILWAPSAPARGTKNG